MQSIRTKWPAKNNAALNSLYNMLNVQQILQTADWSKDYNTMVH